MAGYPITSLKKADQLNGLDAVLISQDGLTKQAEKSVMDQAVIVTQSGAQSSGIIRREGTFVLKSSTLINFTLENATGRKTVNNVTSDNAEAAAGWKVYIYNVSTINHTVIHGANSWTVAAGETLCFYWTGSKFTLHTEVMQDLTVKGNTKLPNVSAVQSITGSDDLAVITSGGLLKKTTPNDIKTALNLVNTTALNSALVDYAKSITSNVLNTKVAHYSIEFEHKNYCSTSLLFAMRGGNSVIVNIGIGDGNAVQTPQAIYSQKIDNQTMSVNFKTNGSYKADLYISSSVYAQYLNVSNLIPSSAKVTFVEVLDSLPEGTSAITVKEGVTQTDLNGALADLGSLKYNTIDFQTYIQTNQTKYITFGNAVNVPLSNGVWIIESTRRNTDVIQIAKRLNNTTPDTYSRVGKISNDTITWSDWEIISVAKTTLDGALADYVSKKNVIFGMKSNQSTSMSIDISSLNITNYCTFQLTLTDFYTSTGQGSLVALYSVYNSAIQRTKKIVDEPNLSVSISSDFKTLTITNTQSKNLETISYKIELFK